MQAIVELPETLMRELEALARKEGSTSSDVIRRIVQAHLASHSPGTQRSFAVSLPLIPASETGTIQPVTGAGIDRLLA